VFVRLLLNGGGGRLLQFVVERDGISVTTASCIFLFIAASNGLSIGYLLSIYKNFWEVDDL